MDSDYCSVCYSRTQAGELYCSRECRLRDTSDELFSSNGPSTSPTATQVQAPPRSRAWSGSSEEEADETDFVYPGYRNMVSTGATRLNGKRLPRGNLRFNPPPVRMTKSEDDLDVEIDLFHALTKPTSLEHRSAPPAHTEDHARKVSNYVFKKAFPAALQNF